MKVLIVEDDLRQQAEYFRYFSRAGFEVLQAETLEKAEELFRKNKNDINAIVLDGCIGGDDFNTLDLSRKFRAEFQGLMVAAVTSEEVRGWLVTDGGCNIGCEKHRTIPTVVQELHQ